MDSNDGYIVLETALQEDAQIVAERVENDSFLIL